MGQNFILETLQSFWSWSFSVNDDAGKPKPRVTLKFFLPTPYTGTRPFRNSREGQPPAACLWIAQIDQSALVADVAVAFQPGKALLWTHPAKLRIDGDPPPSCPTRPNRRNGSEWSGGTDQYRVVRLHQFLDTRAVHYRPPDHDTA